MASCAALIIQSLAANLGVVTGLSSVKLAIVATNLVSMSALIQLFVSNVVSLIVGKHLAEHCRNEYPRVPNFILWVLAEIAIVACDIPEGKHVTHLLEIVKYECSFFYCLIV